MAVIIDSTGHKQTVPSGPLYENTISEPVMVQCPAYETLPHMSNSKINV